MRERIVEELRKLEQECQVRVLLAVESGSRAWGFASPDSDYDVRFIYAHPRDWYLSVLEQRDVIERMLPGDLDLSGWELRKALRLFAKCNLALNEWILSPEMYLSVPQFTGKLSALMPGFFNPIAGLHHYRRMAQASLEDNYRDGRMGIKKVFYVLRPLLACRWIEHLRTQPPTEFSRLAAAEWVDAAERAWIEDLLRQKALAAEKQQLEIEAGRITAIRSELDRYVSIAAALPGPQKAQMSELDELLRSTLV